MTGHENGAAGRVLAIDVGTHTLGLAISDEERVVAFPLETLRRKNKARDLQRIVEIVQDRGVKQIVVGLPLNLDGSPGAMTDPANAVADALAAATDCRIERWDERMSTVQAERVLLSADVSRKKRKQVIDKLAATVILQAFLDRQEPSRER